MAKQWPRHYAFEASKLATHEERKEYVDSEVPEDFRPIVITYLKIELMWIKHADKLRRKAAEPKPTKKAKTVRKVSRGRGTYSASWKPFDRSLPIQEKPI